MWWRLRSRKAEGWPFADTWQDRRQGTLQECLTEMQEQPERFVEHRLHIECGECMYCVSGAHPCVMAMRGSTLPSDPTN